jgi:hypothetical protein
MHVETRQLHKHNGNLLAREARRDITTKIMNK